MIEPSDIVRLVASLAAILGMIVLLAWVLRRLNGVPVAGRSLIQLQGGLSLGAREKVLLLQVGDTQILVATTPGNISKLHVFDEPVTLPLPSSAAPASGFAELLQNLKGGGSR